MSPQNDAADYTRSPSAASPPQHAAPRLADVPSECAGMRLDRVLAQLFPEYSRSRLQVWVRQARVTVEGRTCTASAKVWGGERIRLVPELDAQDAAVPEDIPLTVVHEDAALIVIDKPAGLVVHPGSGNRAGTLMNALLHRAPELAVLPRAGIVHRLDKDTSGLLVVARTLAAQTSLVRQLQARTVSRTYLALVVGTPAGAGKVEAPVGRHPQHRTKMAVVASGKPAVTHHRVLERGTGWSLVECRLETGRTHQIRVHMAHIGHALVGDPVYLPRQALRDLPSAVRNFPRQALHATALALEHPAHGGLHEWHSSLPVDMRDLLETLKHDAPSR